MTPTLTLFSRSTHHRTHHRLTQLTLTIKQLIISTLHFCVDLSTPVKLRRKTFSVVSDPVPSERVGNSDKESTVCKTMRNPHQGPFRQPLFALVNFFA